VGFGTDLKIMVSPVRIRVPPLIKVLQIAEKVRRPGEQPGTIDRQSQELTDGFTEIAS
jgi:hypothetical protein